MHRLFFNGINGATGGYLSPAKTPAEVSKRAQHEAFGRLHLAELEDRIKGPVLEPREGLDPLRIEQVGWGVVFADEDPGTVEALRGKLAPLLDLRREQAGKLYKEFVGVGAGESKTEFLERHKVGPGPPSHGRVPYYLLLVASPLQVPYVFQYELDVQYAVGRLQFDSLDDYATYARAVVAAERRDGWRDRKVTFVGVENPGDVPTYLSRSRLIEPLATFIEQSRPDWRVERRIGGTASKKSLLEALSGSSGLVFTASHGMGFPKGDARQRELQGALLCQDWPGPWLWQKPVPEEFFVAAHDLDGEVSLHGLVAFFFACYSAGTPHELDFAHGPDSEEVELPAQPFVARLPQRLLSHPNLGALAVIGHVDRAWSFSFSWDDQIEHTAAFEDTLARLLSGHPVGSAVEPLNKQYAELATVLSSRLEDIRRGRRANDEWLADYWTATNDARAYAIVGDPAVRLAVARAAIEP